MHCFRLSVDQGNANAQYCYGSSLLSETGIAKELKLAAHSFKLSAD
jgi:hypothetical protein